MLIVRPAETDDAPAIAKVHVEAWQSTYRGIIPQDYLDSLTVQQRTISWIRILERGSDLVTMVSEDHEGRIVGFASAGPNRKSDVRFLGEISSLYVLPRAQRRGHGTRLFMATADRLHRRNLKGLMIWVLAANPARTFYQVMGGEPVDETVRDFAGAPLKEVAYGWRDTPSYS